MCLLQCLYRGAEASSRKCKRYRKNEPLVSEKSLATLEADLRALGHMKLSHLFEPCLIGSIFIHLVRRAMKKKTYYSAKSKRKPSSTDILKVLTPFSFILLFAFYAISPLTQVLNVFIAQKAVASSPLVTSTTPLQHIIIMEKKSRTFDHYFGTFPNANGATTYKDSSGVTHTLAHASDYTNR